MLVHVPGNIRSTTAPSESNATYQTRHRFPGPGYPGSEECALFRSVPPKAPFPGNPNLGSGPLQFVQERIDEWMGRIWMSYYHRLNLLGLPLLLMLCSRSGLLLWLLTYDKGGTAVIKCSGDWLGWNLARMWSWLSWLGYIRRHVHHWILHTSLLWLSRRDKARC